MKLIDRSIDLGECWIEVNFLDGSAEARKCLICFLGAVKEEESLFRSDEGW